MNPSDTAIATPAATIVITTTSVLGEYPAVSRDNNNNTIIMVKYFMQSQNGVVG